MAPSLFGFENLTKAMRKSKSDGIIHFSSQPEPLSLKSENTTNAPTHDRKNAQVELKCGGVAGSAPFPYPRPPRLSDGLDGWWAGRGLAVFILYSQLFYNH